MSSAFLASATLAGVASHLFFFKHGERHLYPFRYLQSFLLACITITVAQRYHAELPVSTAVTNTAKYASLYLFGLYGSLVAYRLFFNPLNKISGPYWSRLSKFDFVSRAAPRLNSQQVLLDLHQQYGHFLRIGPNDVSITHPDGVDAVLGNKSKCNKAPWYDLDYPLMSMHTSRDRAIHDRRRRIWSPAFSDRALRGYEQRIRGYNDLLIKKLDESNGQPLDMAQWFNWYSFDVMGELGFGASFDMLSSGETHWAIKILNAGMDPIGLCLPPWLLRVLIAIPGLSGDWWKFNDFAASQLDKRISVQGKNENPDVTHFLLEPYLKNDQMTQKAQLPLLQADTKLIIVAGSDTTAATIVHLFYHIAAEPGLLGRLREEIDSLVPLGKGIEHQRIQDATVLNGAINETLRLHPPVPSGGFRKTPVEGVEIGGVYIPGNTVVQIPYGPMGRDPSIWPSPEAFLPERYSSRRDLMPYPGAFAPFSIGPYGCIGKNLAYLEIRMLAAQIVRLFDVRLADGETGEELLSGSKDHFTVGLGALRMCFERRK
ncbi:putative P450 monooxygenase [Exophiala viscosa]|uniref:putative P450 monooxygenase n=1 Tax=Exophiala viscosa TaxID=2486360 RepID=UPI00219FCDAD|nr:putative P450 monooxygenase [Exophiala viscosa]